MTDTQKGPRKPSYQNRVAYHATLLGGFALLVTSILVAGDIFTRDEISTRLEEDTIAMIGQVIPPAIHDNNIVESVKHIELSTSGNAPESMKVYQATEKGKVVAVAYEMVGQGYAGPIKIIMGVDRKGTLLGVRVISHLETPGLGDKIEEKKSGWIHGFDRISFTSLKKELWNVKKDGGRFDQFSGATITPRAVVKTIRTGLETFNLMRDQMLSLEENESFAASQINPTE